MADTVEIDRLDPEQYTGLIRAALHPDERKFFKEYLGQDTPDISDYLQPQGRFAQARKVREDIVRSALQQIIPSANNPMATLGEARSIHPNFPAPPSAQNYAPAEGPGPPVATGIIPGQGMSPELLRTPTSLGTMQDSVNQQYAQRGSPYFTEGPRPVSPVPTEDMNAILPRSHQNLLIAKVHQAGLRPFSPNSTLKSDLYQHYQDLMTGQKPESYQGEAQAVGTMLGVTPKEHSETSALGRKNLADATTAEVKAKAAPEVSAANLNKTYAQTANTDARTQTDNTLRAARLNKLNADVILAQKKAELAGDLSAAEKIKEDGIKLKVYKDLMARGQLSDEEAGAMLSDLYSLRHMGISNDPATAFQEFFGMKPSGIHVQPNAQPQGAVAPTGDPMQIPGGVVMPQAQGQVMNPEPVTENGPGAPAAPIDKKAMAKALYDRMKEGDVQTFDGVKYKKQGTKLVRVQ